MFKKGELQLLWPFYLDALISPLLFFLPAFSTVYFLSIGLSLFQIGIILGVRPAFSLLFEVPTGAIADIYGRKASVLLSFILAAIGYFALFFFTDFYALVIIFAFLGFASTFYSGSKEAWVVDLIKFSKKDFIKGYFAKTQALDHFALIFSGILGGILVKQFGLSVIFLFAGGSYVLAFIFSLFAKEVYKKNSAEKSIVMQTKKSINYARKHHVLYYLLIAGAILSFAGTLVASLSQTPLLLSLGFQEHWFGYFWSMLAIFGIFANIASARFLSKWDDKLVIVGTTYTFLKHTVCCYCVVNIGIFYR
jgi:MFS family permease